MSKHQLNKDEAEVNFELELNLQSVRRELIRLLEAAERSECLACCSLRCRCPAPAPPATPRSSRSSSISPTNTLDESGNKSYEKVEAWVKSCSAVEKKATTNGREVANVTWPPELSSIWNDEEMDAEKLIKLQKMQKNANVDAFFKKFEDIHLTPDMITGALSLMQIRGAQTEQMNLFASAIFRKFAMPQKSATDYSYF